MNEIFVEKFGGASVNSAQAVKNVASILLSEKKKRLVVVSAMGKTTNNLEKIVNNFHLNSKIDYNCIETIKEYHINIITELFNGRNLILEEILDNIFEEITNKLLYKINKPYDEVYDSIVSYGEIICTTIISNYFSSLDFNHHFVLPLYLLMSHPCDLHNIYHSPSLVHPHMQGHRKRDLVYFQLSLHTVATQHKVGRYLC